MKECFGTISVEKIESGNCNSCTKDQKTECLNKKFDYTL